MDEYEISRTGVEFKSHVIEEFGFLITEFGFESAIDESSTYSHCLTFRNAQRGQLVEVKNAFHPVDYGFEINLQPASGRRRTDDRNMIYSRLKEDQDSEFRYLAEAAMVLRKALE